ncbi:MAG: hypothetical protein JW774_00350 [Candidatus Aureabacteria bacterium]|nr:hypothetical protein [Candidatus Auribacterota bacterium]
MITGGHPELHPLILEKAEKLKQSLEDLFQFSVSWAQPLHIMITHHKTRTEIKWNKKALSRIIYFSPGDHLKYLELDRELIRILLYDLILTEPEIVNHKHLMIPLWLVEGLLYNIRTDELITPHFLYESQKMNGIISLEELLTRQTFFLKEEQNILFSFEAASLTEYLFSLPLGDVKLKRYLLLCQQETSSELALLKAFERHFTRLGELKADWIQKAKMAGGIESNEVE